MPNRFQWNGAAPSVASSEKIFTPTNSAMMALVRKKPAQHDEQPVGLVVDRAHRDSPSGTRSY